MPQLASRIWEDGPALMPSQPAKRLVRDWGTWVENVIASFLASQSGGLIFSSRAALFADLAHPANSSAWVIGDANIAYNGVYMKNGASGSGSWTRVSDLPFSFIIANNSGAGTANAIQATTSIPVSGSALVVANIVAANTSSPVTIQFNGGPVLTVKTNSGQNVLASGLASGMLVAGYVTGSTFRLISDQASAAVLAAAEDAISQYETIRDTAESALQPTDIGISVSRQIELDAKRDGVVGDGATPISTQLQTTYNRLSSSTAIANVIVLSDPAYYNVNTAITKPGGKLVILQLKPGANLGGSAAGSVPYDIMESWEQASYIAKTIAKTERYWDYGYAWSVKAEAAFQLGQRRTSHLMNHVGPTLNNQSTEFGNVSRYMAPDITDQLPQGNSPDFDKIYSKIGRVDYMLNQDRRGNNVAYSPQAVMEGGAQAGLAFGATHISAYTGAINPLVEVSEGTIGYAPVIESNVIGLWYRATDRSGPIVVMHKMVSLSAEDHFAGLHLATGPNGGNHLNGIFADAESIPADGHLINYEGKYSINSEGEVDNYLTRPFSTTPTGTGVTSASFSGRMQRTGKRFKIIGVVSVTSASGGAGALNVPLPFGLTAALPSPVSGIRTSSESSVKQLIGGVFTNGTSFSVTNSDGTSVIASGFTGLVEVDVDVL
ncbi:hypothetical protein [Oryzifoliimicrobium ureilyticus]|uniref:hypothetical protein n=1 Tax=Oryzifoliimicrobium ureilyticus TaxID=3113724 RepID=UPI0030767F3C